MKRLFLTFLVALALPIALNAESYKASVVKIQWPKMQKLLVDAYVLLDSDDMNTACSKLKEFDLLLGIHSEGLQELYPNKDWFGIKKKNEMLKGFC